MKSRWLWLLLAVPLALGLSRLRFDTEILNLLPARLPEVQGLKLWQENFAGSADLLITIRTDDAELSARLAESLAGAMRAEPGLTKEIHWQAPWREHPGDSAELVATMWLNQPPGVLAELRNRLEPDRVTARLTQLREQLTVSLSPDELARLSYDPLGLLDLPGAATPFAQASGDGPPFASADGTFRVIHVQPPPLTGGYQASIDWLKRINERIAAWQTQTTEAKELKLGLTGGPAFVAEISSSMENDMRGSATGTALIVALLFGLAHRRLRPLLWMIALLGLILLFTMAAGGLIFGRLNVVSLGFAAILLGLGVDYALVLYQERLTHPGHSLAEVRRWTSSGIWWSAVTTAGAFALLNFGGLPGLAQLGSLVAIGVTVSAGVMIAWFLPPLESSFAGEKVSARADLEMTGLQRLKWALPVASLFLAFGAFALVSLRAPGIDASATPLRPTRSAAYEVMAELRRELGGDETWPVLVTGASEQAVADRFARLQTTLTELAGSGLIESFTLPDALWPNPRHQVANDDAVAGMLAREDAVITAAKTAGFTDDSLALGKQVFATWSRAMTTTNRFAADNAVSRWALRQSAARADGRWIAAGMIKPVPESDGSAWINRVQGEGVIVAAWERLGPAIFNEVKSRLGWLFLAVIAAQLFALWMAFRNLREVALSLATLALAGLLLLALMSLAGWSWNLMNLMAVPLLLGATEDYSIHTQLALRRHGGDLRRTFHSTGKAVLLCAATTVAGFSSLAFSSNAGLASLGKICAAGVACAAFVTCGFLPAWWRLFCAARGVPGAQVAASKPSRLYGSFAWRLGMACVRALPGGLARFAGVTLARCYAAIAVDRRRIVEANLLPAVNGDVPEAKRLTRQLFKNFGIKIADLLRYESGVGVDPLFCELPTRERFTLPPGRGVLLLTIHLGNWEFGAPLLRRIGVNLVVITLAEPGTGFTKVRERARQRWGVETLVIGQDAFAFVEVLKRLQAGAVIALLVDRPPAGSGVAVELFGRPFNASVSAAELARASGCALLPVVIPWTSAGYEVLALPEIGYERAKLGDRESRRVLTQEILRAFEPVIRQHPDQWFHFVPIWPPK